MYSSPTILSHPHCFGHTGLIAILWTETHNIYICLKAFSIFLSVWLICHPQFVQIIALATQSQEAFFKHLILKDTLLFSIPIILIYFS